MTFLTGSALWSRPLLPLDETRYLAVAWEMQTSGDYMVSHLNGETYAHKPPLLFWLINLAWTLGGVGEIAGRLVVPLISLLSVIMTDRIARRLWPESELIAQSAAAVHCSSMIWMLLSTVTMFDTLLTLCVQIAIYGILQLESEFRQPDAHTESNAEDRSSAGASGRFSKTLSFGTFLLGLGLGLGLLAKGPVVMIHVMPVAFGAGSWSTAVRTQTVRWLLQILKSIGLAAALALSWVIPSAWSGGSEYSAELLWGQTAHRMVNSFAHKEPFWWYLIVLPLIALPWLTIGAVWRSRRQELSMVNQASFSNPVLSTRLLTVWTGGSLLLLSMVSGKQIHYLMPIVPAIALLIAGRLVGGNNQILRSDLSFIIGGTLFGGLLPLIFNLFPEISAGRLAGVTSSWLSIPLCLCVVNLLFLRDRSVVNTVRQIAMSSVLFISLLVIGLKGNFWGEFDYSRLAVPVREFQAQNRTVGWIGEYAGQMHFCGRLEQPVEELMSEAETLRWLGETEKPVAVLRVFDPEISLPPDRLAPLFPDDLKRVERSLLASESNLWPGYTARLLSGFWVRRGLSFGLMVIAEFEMNDQTKAEASQNQDAQ
ncbi:MAG: ArnT family glycosyltransferase [Planctomyces sp.]